MSYQAFFTHLHRGGQHAYFHTLPARRSFWFTAACPPDYDLSQATSNVYFGVHPSSIIPATGIDNQPVAPRYVRSRIATIAAINCLYAEFDTKDYGDKPTILAHLDRLVAPAPSCIIDSGGGIHAYWLIDRSYMLDTDDRRRAAQYLQTAWVSLVGGDPGAHDLARVLRVPGSVNYKYDPPRPVQWLRRELMITHPIIALSSCLPPKPAQPERLAVRIPNATIQDFNESHDIGDVLARYGYEWRGRRKMLSPYSSTGTPGVTIDTDTNRAYVHHGGDPLHDGYWKRPFDVMCRLDHGGDVRKALKAIRGQS